MLEWSRKCCVEPRPNQIVATLGCALQLSYMNKRIKHKIELRQLAADSKRFIVLYSMVCFLLVMVGKVD